MNLVIIPARGGSKRIPRKNIKYFCGKPIIAWSIEAAKKASSVDKIIVSTDDKEIAEISESFGAEVPFMRPLELSDDFTETIPVIKHAINELLKKDEKISNVCCVYATAPFLTPRNIDEGFLKLNSNDCDYVISTTSYPYPIERALRVFENNFIKMINPKNYKKRSQDFEETLHDAGQFYWGSLKTWLSELKLLSSRTISLPLPRYRVQDIDTQEDWIHAERLFKSMTFKSKD